MCRHIVFYFKKCNCLASAPIVVEPCEKGSCLLDHFGPHGFQRAVSSPYFVGSLPNVEEIPVPDFCWHHRRYRAPFQVPIRGIEDFVWHVPEVPGPPPGLFREDFTFASRLDKETVSLEVCLDDDISPLTDNPINREADTRLSKSVPTSAQKSSSELGGGIQSNEPTDAKFAAISLTTSLPARRDARREYRVNKQTRRREDGPARLRLSTLEPSMVRPLKLSEARRVDKLSKRIERELEKVIDMDTYSSPSEMLVFDHDIWNKTSALQPFNFEHQDMMPTPLNVWRKNLELVQAVDHHLQSIHPADEAGASELFDSDDHRFSQELSLHTGGQNYKMDIDTNRTLTLFSHASMDCPTSHRPTLKVVIPPSSRSASDIRLWPPQVPNNSQALSYSMPSEETSMHTKRDDTSFYQMPATPLLQPNERRFSFLSPLSPSLEFLDLDSSCDEDNAEEIRWDYAPGFLERYDCEVQIHTAVAVPVVVVARADVRKITLASRVHSRCTRWFSSFSRRRESQNPDMETAQQNSMHLDLSKIATHGGTDALPLPSPNTFQQGLIQSKSVQQILSSEGQHSEAEVKTAKRRTRVHLRWTDLKCHCD